MANRKIGKSENTSLARAVASLERTGNTCKYFGTFFSPHCFSPSIFFTQLFFIFCYRKFGMSEVRKIEKLVNWKSGSPEIQNFGSLVNRKFGNWKHRKIRGSGKRKFR